MDEMSMSSDLYKRSRSDKYKQYFSQSSDMVKMFARYSLEQVKCEPPRMSKPWDKGCAGVPLFWDPTTKTVYNDSLDTHTGNRTDRLKKEPFSSYAPSAYSWCWEREYDYF